MFQIASHYDACVVQLSKQNFRGFFKNRVNSDTVIGSTVNSGTVNCSSVNGCTVQGCKLKKTELEITAL
jgi:hypothetical protein